MNEDWDPAEDRQRPDAVASATAPALPCLKKDNCISNGRYRSVFVAQSNIEFYIRFAGENHVGAVTVTAADCLQARDFQAKWHSYLNALKKHFPTGMWTRERQPRSGNWHAHAVVNVGWDLKTGFPRDQVERGFYANVDARLRNLWKFLREKSESHGLGRVELLPLKYSGKACARYFTKYLTKVLGSEKCEGEERCRLFGVWGGHRYVYSRFSFRTSRIMHKRKEWLAATVGYRDVSGLAFMLPTNWWFHFGRALSEVIMPAEYYQVGVPGGGLRWDDIGLAAAARDWASWPGEPSEDVALRSQFNVLRDIGDLMYGRGSKEGLAFALNCLALPEVRSRPCLDEQLLLCLRRQ